METHSSWELFGVECLPGWKDIIQPLFDYIEEYNKDKAEEDKIVINQVKEKFAGLRFYVSNAPDELHNMIEKAEEESYKTCEVCGSKKNVGVLNIHGWYYTRCEDCAKSLVNARKLSGRIKIGDKYIDLYPNQ